jgi:hypothetical protein
MNRRELALALNQQRISSDLYALDGSWTTLANDGYLLAHTRDAWIVQYFERGATRELARFDSESAACDYLYQRLTNATTLEQLRSRIQGKP